MGELTKMGQSLRERWTGLNLRQRVTILVSLGLLAATLAIVVTYASRPDYSPLFTNLTPEDASAIGQSLTDKKIPFKAGPDGSSILVPTRQLYQTRWAVAAEGLPKGGGVGFEIFDKTQIGATDFDRRVSYARAVQGELERTFRQMPEVDNARVMIVLPEQDPFALSDKKSARASVFLQLKPGVELDSKQVRGVIQLVSHSVDGLLPEDVTVTDVHGRILNPPVMDDPGAVSVDVAAASQLQQQKAFQSELQRSLQTLLEQVLGPGNVATRVTAELNFDTRTQDRQLFEPMANGEGVLRSMQQVQKSFSGTQDPGTVVGTDPNLPTPPVYQNAGGGGTSQSEENSVTKNYEISEVREHVQVAPGSVKRLSVAVVVNPPKDKAFGADQQKAIHDMVAAAIGVDTSRNDQISVTAIPFDNTVAAAIQKEMDQSRQEKANQIRMMWIAAGAAVVLLSLVLIFRRRGRALEPSLAGMPGGAYPMGASGVPGAQQAAAGALSREGAALLATLAHVQTKELTPEELERQRVREEVEKLAQTKPEDVAALLKGWLNDE
ncbi:MAG: flagellar basal-body MS-ring/collar protein FliF [Bacillota bacterium]